MLHESAHIIKSFLKEKKILNSPLNIR